MNHKNSQGIFIATLVVALTLAIVSIAYADFVCYEVKEVWQLKIVAKTVDGEPVDDLSEYEEVYISLVESTAFPVLLRAVELDESTQEVSEEIIRFDFASEDQ